MRKATIRRLAADRPRERDTDSRAGAIQYAYGGAAQQIVASGTAAQVAADAMHSPAVRSALSSA
jgi:hypothetical protein